MNLIAVWHERVPRTTTFLQASQAKLWLQFIRPTGYNRLFFYWVATLDLHIHKMHKTAAAGIPLSSSIRSLGGQMDTSTGCHGGPPSVQGGPNLTIYTPFIGVSNTKDSFEVNLILKIPKSFRNTIFLFWPVLAGTYNLEPSAANSRVVLWTDLGKIMYGLKIQFNKDMTTKTLLNWPIYHILRSMRRGNLETSPDG